MNVGIISDTHNDLENLTLALDLLDRLVIERLYHCGDWTTREASGVVVAKCQEKGWQLCGVTGNRDESHHDLFGEFLGLPFLKISAGLLVDQIDNGSIAVHHGHVPEITKAAFATPEVRYIFSGHVHQPEIKSVGEITLINPGSVCRPSDSIPGTQTCVWLDTKTREHQLISLAQRG